MKIEYKTTRYIRKADLKELFLSVEWGSGKYPDLLCEAMKRYDIVISAWDGQKLVGLTCVMSDGFLNAYVQYVLVNPAYQGRGIGRNLMEMVKHACRNLKTLTLVAYEDARGFYEKCGMSVYPGTTVLHISSLPD